jgi:hypothetical protein
MRAHWIRLAVLLVQSFQVGGQFTSFMTTSARESGVQAVPLPPAHLERKSYSARRLCLVLGGEGPNDPFQFRRMGQSLLCVWLEVHTVLSGTHMSYSVFLSSPSFSTIGRRCDMAEAGIEPAPSQGRARPWLDLPGLVSSSPAAILAEARLELVIEPSNLYKIKYDRLRQHVNTHVLSLI